MDRDFRVGPLLGTFHFVKKSLPLGRGGVEDAPPRKGQTLKSLSFESYTLLLNFHFLLFDS